MQRERRNLGGGMNMDKYEMAVKVLKWAKEHPQEWNVVCGIQDADLDENLTIAGMLRDERFYELCLMLTIRATMMLLEDEE